jgi:cob(I)alamin adenosyltransferase|tara:strand:+ start:52 stop:240 length:189 start_codon:yes stop_codon:yes gene_type:complete
MTELTQEHFELHDQNKDRNYKEQKIKFLEDRIATLEKSVESLTKVVGELREMDIKRTLGLEK